MTELIVTNATRAQSFIQNPIWYHALTLSERQASCVPGCESTALRQHDAELARRRIEKWRNQPPFANDQYLEERLEMDHLTMDEFSSLLGEHIEAVMARTTPPEWLCVLEQAFMEYDQQSQQDFPAPKQGSQLNMFLHPLLPLFKKHFARLQKGSQEVISQHAFIPFEEHSIVPFLFSNLANQLLPVVTKALTLELHIARLQGRLKGATSEERFHSFVQQLCTAEAMVTFLETYPVLARTMMTIADCWVSYSLEFITHICADWQEICRCFSPIGDPGKLEEIRGGAGDTHRQGRSVMQLKFQSGFKLLYKPRSLTIDIHFHRLLNWLNMYGDHPPLHGVKVLDKGTYGWSEFVEARSCTSEAEIERFYKRQGAFLALLYAFEATDFHHENLIACGEDPMLIDLEAFFQPRFTGGVNEDTKALPPGLRLLQHSVLRAGLLPNRQWANAENVGIDISGLGGSGGQLSPHPLAVLEDIGTDQMRLIRQRIKIRDQQNRPKLHEDAVDILHYTDYVIEGFKCIYQLLLEHREELLRDILPAFAHDEIRVIMRPTKTYAQLLQESIHPTLLRDALTRERFFDRLWGAVPQSPFLVRVIAEERADLLMNDVPLFASYPDSHHLYNSHSVCIADFFQETCLVSVQRHIQILDDADLSIQLWIIRASLATVTLGSGQTTWKHTQLHPSLLPASRPRLMDAACAVGDRLCELALQNEDEVSWLNLQMFKEREWSLSITSLDLYNGVIGIGIFLAQLGVIAQKNAYTTLARLALETVRKRQKEIEGSFPLIGGFEGWGAFIYFYTYLGVLWNEPGLLAEAKEIVEIVSTHIEQDDLLDVMGGSAGCIYSLLNLYSVVPSPRTLEVAVQCGEHLVNRAKKMPEGVGWLTPMSADDPLVGFSHGVAGIGLGLLKLAQVSGEERFREIGLAAIAYERSAFSPENQNWPDLRDANLSGITSEDVHRMVTWCHGAPGIGLARLETLRYMADEQIYEEIEIALATTRERGFGLNHSLCHGDLGNLDVLLTASQVLKNASYREDVEQIASMILTSIDEQGWCTGVPLSTETPGLMTGIAGIGYELLRLAEPEMVPSVLLLGLPVKKNN